MKDEVKNHLGTTLVNAILALFFALMVYDLGINPFGGDELRVFGLGFTSALTIFSAILAYREIKENSR